MKKIEDNNTLVGVVLRLHAELLQPSAMPCKNCAASAHLKLSTAGRTRLKTGVCQVGFLILCAIGVGLLGNWTPQCLTLSVITLLASGVHHRRPGH